MVNKYVQWYFSEKNPFPIEDFELISISFSQVCITDNFVTDLLLTINHTNTNSNPRSSLSVAVDGQGRVWVLTLARQLKKEEQAGIGVSIGIVDGKQQVGYKVIGDTDLRKTDAYKLEVFDGEGVLLGEIPLDIFVDHIFIYGDRLFLLDKLHGATVHIFRIM